MLIVRFQILRNCGRRFRSRTNVEWPIRCPRPHDQHSLDWPRNLGASISGLPEKIFARFRQRWSRKVPRRARCHPWDALQEAVNVVRPDWPTRAEAVRASWGRGRVSRTQPSSASRWSAYQPRRKRFGRGWYGRCLHPANARRGWVGQGREELKKIESSMWPILKGKNCFKSLKSFYFLRKNFMLSECQQSET